MRPENAEGGEIGRGLISYPALALTSAWGGCILSRAIVAEAKIGKLAPVAEWYTRQVEGLCPFGRGGSSPVPPTNGYIPWPRDRWMAMPLPSAALRESIPVPQQPHNSTMNPCAVL